MSQSLGFFQTLSSLNSLIACLLQTEKQLDCALDLMRRLPPQQIEKNLSDLIDLVPDLCEDLLSSVDQPLKIARDKQVGKDYLLCDYNRDGDSYRSPWNNTYCPAIDSTFFPSADLRRRKHCWQAVPLTLLLLALK